MPSNPATPGLRWSVFITNRSLVAQLFTLLFMVLAICGVPLLIPAEVAADAVYGIASALMALVECFYGKTRVIWTKDQACRAKSEAAALSRALQDAGAP